MFDVTLDYPNNELFCAQLSLLSQHSEKDSIRGKLKITITLCPVPVDCTISYSSDFRLRTAEIIRWKVTRTFGSASGHVRHD